ncbi:hypothetical protein WJX72_004293 [[Myrmecia] bisecta]|uniref:Pyroglutamyl-peptidase I n=1 Tax=[Myrmecia] bisecta TaxID=41462 RepID=A0AAW1Q3Z1_9CHLO
MGSEVLPAPVRFVVTGFSVFSGVDANPTEELIRSLPGWLEQRGRALPGGAKVVTCTTLRVSVKDVDAWLAEEAQRIQADPDSGPVIWVHFGVDVRAQQIRLEVQAANETNFRCPDADGWQPSCEPICSEGPPSLTSHLPLDRLLGALQAGGHNVVLSTDAGEDEHVPSYP